ncbi:hypothetical protein GLOIN_2v1482674 [Rhizophagus clarus]|uniref:SAM domain-containing protein n=1 Tax=Rhizophagus clarus TaxID=94130 RepID=A0A8H3LDJ2_9GLOM|nr:hypothetical protein GLOIN_2v1482674 [Rhizophagus clarus]
MLNRIRDHQSGAIVQNQKHIVNHTGKSPCEKQDIKHVVVEVQPTFCKKTFPKQSNMSSIPTKADMLKEYGTESLINFLRGDSKLQIEVGDLFTKLEEEKITSHLFLKLTRQEFREFGMKLRPALELEDYIKELYSRKRTNLMEHFHPKNN